MGNAIILFKFSNQLKSWKEKKESLIMYFISVYEKRKKQYKNKTIQKKQQQKAKQNNIKQHKQRNKN